MFHRIKKRFKNIKYFITTNFNLINNEIDIYYARMKEIKKDKEIIKK